MDLIYLNRNKRNSIVLIPGWASDYRIFDALDLEFNYIIPKTFSTATFKQELQTELKQMDVSSVSVFGWSMGAFLAVDFALTHMDMVNELFLVGIRKKYNPKDIALIKDYLKKSKKGYLYKFYTECFANKEEGTWFRENLLKTYCKEMDTEKLVDTLDYLSSVEMSSEHLLPFEKLTIIHGECDKIAPVEEAREIINGLPRARFISFQDTGHMPFLRERFSGKL